VHWVKQWQDRAAPIIWREKGFLPHGPGKPIPGYLGKKIWRSGIFPVNNQGWHKKGSGGQFFLPGSPGTNLHTMSQVLNQSYADDLSQRIGLNETRLKPELTFSVLLNACHRPWPYGGKHSLLKAAIR
jgi:hypothetical protein